MTEKELPRPRHILPSLQPSSHPSQHSCVYPTLPPLNLSVETSVMDHQQHHQQHHHQQQFLAENYPQHRDGNFGGESHEQGISRHSPQHHHQHHHHDWENTTGSGSMSLWNDNTATATSTAPAVFGKRARELCSSPTPLSDNSESGMMQSSFKRLKVMDDCSSNADSLYSTITNYSSMAEPPSRSDDSILMATQHTAEYYQHQYLYRGALPSHRHSSFNHLWQQQEQQQEQHVEWCREQEQSAGQESSSEPSTSTGYQSMNALLGDLHLLRCQREAGDQPAAQHPAAAPPTSLENHHHDYCSTTGTLPQQHSVRRPVSSTKGGISSLHKKPVSLRTSSKLL